MRESNRMEGGGAGGHCGSERKSRRESKERKGVLSELSTQTL